MGQVIHSSYFQLRDLDEFQGHMILHVALPLLAFNRGQ